MKRLVISCVYLCVVLTAARSLAEENIIAIVNNECITQKDLDDFTTFMRIQLEAENGAGDIEERIASMKKDLLEKLIEDKLILQQAKKNNISVDDSRIKSRLNDIRKKYPSSAAFKEALKSQGLVEADIETRLRDQALMITVIDKMVKSKVIVPPREITEFFEQNKSQFLVPEERHFLSVATQDITLAQQIYSDYIPGQDLKKTALEFGVSAMENNAAQDGTLNKEVEDLLFSLKSGELSRPFKIEGLYYLFQVDNIVASRPLPLKEVQSMFYDRLYNEKMRQKLLEWIDGLKKAAYIKIM
jgi:parvulin-like peptidyl-prolyl isomerase